MALNRAAGQGVCHNSGNPVTSVNFTFPASVVANNAIAVGAHFDNDPTAFSYSDGLSNTYQSDVIRHQGNPHFEGVGIGSCLKITTGGSCTVTVSVTGAGASQLGFEAMEYEGFGTGGAAKDQTATNVGTTVNFDSGTTATTTAADEVLFSAESDQFNLTPITYSGSFTKLTEDGRGGAADRIVAATGTYNATGTGSNATNWTGAIVTYKAAAVAAVGDTRDASIPIRPTGPVRRRSFQQVYADTPETPVELTQTPAAPVRPGGMGPRLRRALPQLYPDSPVTPTELTQTPAAPFAPIGPRRRRSIPQQYADTPVIPTELTQSPAAPFRPGRGPGMGPMLLRRNLVWPSPDGTASSDVTVALTGVQGTGAVGTLGVTLDVALTGNTATASVGTLTPGTTVTLTGLAATGSVGTLAPSTDVALTGVAGTASVGTFTPGTTLGITGVEGTGSIGTLAPDLAVTLTGNQATVTIGTLFPSGDVTVALTGVSATLSIGDLTASGGDVPVSVDTNTPGFRRLGRSQLNVEDEAEKLARRIREGTIKPPPVQTPADDSAYFKESARLAQAIATARADAETSRKAIARYTKQQELKAHSAKVEAKLIRAEQALLLARITEEALMEEMEVIDIAYLAVAVLSITLQ